MKQEQYLTHAISIGYQLCRDAIWSGTRCNWMNKEYESSGKFHYQPMESEFYKGLAGAAFFLAALYRCTDEKLFRQTALGAMNGAMDQVARVEKKHRFSFFRGWAGLILCTKVIAAYCNSSEINRSGEELLIKLKDQKIEGSDIDSINGLASGIPALIAIHNLQTDHILEKLIQKGLFYLEGSPDSEMSGFSHGYSGIAWCFLESYEHMKEERYLRFALDCLQKEDSLIEETVSTGKDKHYLHKDWAHGTVGLGMARWKAYQRTGKTKYLEQASDLTKQSTEIWAEMPFLDFSPCNGIWGLTDLYEMAYQSTDDTSYYIASENIIAKLMNQWSVMGNIWIDPGINNEEVPDFMISLSGVGYGFLRLFSPHNCPSILGLEATAFTKEISHQKPPLVAQPFG